MTQFLSLAASHSPKYTFQAISMHWYGSAQLSVAENGDMLNEQAGAMIQLAKDNNIPEVWITEMGSGYASGSASEEVSHTLSPRLGAHTMINDADSYGIQCQFIQWLEGTFMKNSSNAMITKYAYNEHLGTLLSGASLTGSGSA